MENNHIYVAIDLKLFYASVECVERQFDPMDANLVVADASRTEKIICLAVSPSLKAFGISGWARLFEVVQKVKEVNTMRKTKAPTISFRVNLIPQKNCSSIPNFHFPTSLRRPTWYITWNTAQKYMRFISDILRWKISTCIPSTRYSWT